MQAEKPHPAQFSYAAVFTSSGDSTLLTMTALLRMLWFKHDLCWHNPMPLAGVALWAAQSVSRCPCVWMSQACGFGSIRRRSWLGWSVNIWSIGPPRSLLMVVALALLHTRSGELVLVSHEKTGNG